MANSWQSALEHLGRLRLILTVCLVVIAVGLATLGAALLAPGFDVDLDRAIGLVNLLDLGTAKVATVRRLVEPLEIETPAFDRAMAELKKAPVPPPDLEPVRFDSSGFDQARARFRDRVNAIRRELDEAVDAEGNESEAPHEAPQTRDPPR